MEVSQLNFEERIMVSGAGARAPRSSKKSTSVPDPKLAKVRLTVYLRKALVKKIKHSAVDDEKDVSEVVEQALNQYFKIKSDPEYSEK